MGEGVALFFFWGGRKVRIDMLTGQCAKALTLN